MSQHETESLLALLKGKDDKEKLAIIKRFSESIGKEEDDKDEDADEEVATPKKLRELYESYNKQRQFKPGDLVQWKRGLKDRKFPRLGEPAIVLKVLDTPIIDPDSEAGSPYFRQEYDVVLGILAPGERFLEFHNSSKRFETFEF